MLGESWAPAYDAVLAELGLLRARGLLQLRRLRLESLYRAAVLSGFATGRYAPGAVEELVRAAVTQLGEGTLAAAAAYTFGVVPGTRDWPAHERRRRGAEIYGVGVDRFRKHYEKLVLDQTASAVLALCTTSPPQAARPPQAPTSPGEAPTSPARATASGDAGVSGDAGASSDVVPVSPGVQLRTVEDAGDYALARLLPSAVRVDLYGRTMVSLLNQYAHHLARLVRAGSAVRVLVLDPAVRVGDHLYPLIPGEGQHTLDRDTAAMAARFRLLLEAQREGSGTVLIRTTAFLPPFSMVRCLPRDPAMSRIVAQVSLMFTRTGRDRPLLCVAADSPWHDVLVAEFEEAWERGTPWPGTRRPADGAAAG